MRGAETNRARYTRRTRFYRVLSAVYLDTFRIRGRISHSPGVMKRRISGRILTATLLQSFVASPKETLRVERRGEAKLSFD